MIWALLWPFRDVKDSGDPEYLALRGPEVLRSTWSEPSESEIEIRLFLSGLEARKLRAMSNRSFALCGMFYDLPDDVSFEEARRPEMRLALVLMGREMAEGERFFIQSVEMTSIFEEKVQVKLIGQVTGREKRAHAEAF